MLTNLVNNDLKLKNIKDEYFNYQNKLRNIYGQNKLLSSTYFNMNPSESVTLKDEFQGDLVIYNSYFF